MNEIEIMWQINDEPYYPNEMYHCDYCGAENDDCSCDPDACCYEIGYIGSKDYCHCAEYQKGFEREMHWFYGRFDRLVNWTIRKVKAIKQFFTIEDKSDNDGLPF